MESPSQLPQDGDQALTKTPLIPLFLCAQLSSTPQGWGGCRRAAFPGGAASPEGGEAESQCLPCSTSSSSCGTVKHFPPAPTRWQRVSKYFPGAGSTEPSSATGFISLSSQSGSHQAAIFLPHCMSVTNCFPTRVHRHLPTPRDFQIYS